MIGGQHQVESVLVGGKESAESAHGVHAQEEQHRPTPEQRNALEHVGPDDRLQPAVDRVAAREHADRPDPGRKVEPEDARQCQASRVEYSGQAHNDVDGHQICGHDDAWSRSESELEVFGEGVDAGLEKPGQEHECHEDERDGCNPLEGGDCQSRLKPLAGHADEVLGGDVGSDQRDADEPPGQVAASQEVVGGRVLPAGRVEGYAHHDAEENEEGDEIDPV